MISIMHCFIPVSYTHLDVYKRQGLGSPIALYLTGAGVGCLGLVDDDLVSITNLQRQVIYSDKELGKPKALCAAGRLSALNSGIRIYPYSTRLTKDNAYDIIQKRCV